MKEAWPLWMRHVTYQTVVSHINESCHTLMSHVTYQWVMSHLNESCHISMSHGPYQWAMALISEARHISLSHVPHFSASRLTSMSRVPNQWVMSHIKNSCSISTSHVPHQQVTPSLLGPDSIWDLPRWKWAMTSVSTSHVTFKQVTPSHAPCEWVMSRMNESAIPPKRASYLSWGARMRYATYECVCPISTSHAQHE